jgi:2,3-dimethylmalate lyase
MHLGWIVEATALPVIGDCDAGYGNAINVMRAVRGFERVGVAALHLENQITPKRCGHYEGKEVEAPRDREELKRIADAIDCPLVANMIKGGNTPLLSAAELEALGYKLAIYASDVQRAAIYGMCEVLKILKRDGTPERFAQTIDFPERDAIIGLERVQALEERFLRL